MPIAFGLKSGAAAKVAAPSQNGQKRKAGFVDDVDHLRSDLNGFESVSGFDSDGDSSHKSPKLNEKSFKSQSKNYMNLSSRHSANKVTKDADGVDAGIYDYDAAYDTFQAPQKASKNVKASGPKYMGGLIKSAQTRERDRQRAEEKKLLREREAEGDEFADKEKFVTGAYKAQQEDNTRLEEEEARKEAEEEARRLKGAGMKGFYKDMLQKDEERSAQIQKAQEEAKEKPVSISSNEEPTEDKEAAELNKTGAHIVMNEEGEVVDKRQLLSAGLNVTKKPKDDANVREDLSKLNKPAFVPTMQARGARNDQRERQTQMIAQQLDVMSEKQALAEAEEQKALEDKAKSQKSSTDISSARQRYLARKKAKELELSSAG